MLVDGATAELDGNLIAGHGPGLALASGARASVRMNRWWVDPVFWVDCGSGARVAVGEGSTLRTPLQRVALTRQLRLDKNTRP